MTAIGIARVGAIGLLILAVPLQATATLGADVPSIDRDRVRSQGALIRITRSERFAVHELQSASGTTIREYASSSGKVFAVAWDGPWMPDLRQLLGEYYDEFQRGAAEARRKRRGHGPLTFETGDLIVQIGGHPRAFSGRAYLGSQVPPGVTVDAIR